MHVDNFSGLELLGRSGKKFKFSKKAKRRAVAGALIPLPGAGFRAVASLVKARRAAKGKKVNAKKARRISAGIAAAALIPGAGTIGLMVAAAKRRKKQREAKKKSVGLNVVPPSALPASVAVPQSVGVMNPQIPAPSYSPPPAVPESYDDPIENSYDDPTENALDESEENEASEENEETEETEETKNFWE